MSSDAPTSSGPALAQADTIVAAETPPAPVDVGEGEAAARLQGPRYRGGALLGEGGMGEVRVGRDLYLGREVAVKVLRAAPAGAVTSARQRFLREARVQGQLEHPSVVPVYDLEMDPAGEARLYMKRVRGLTLASVIDGLARGDATMVSRFPRRRLLTAFVSVCRAVDYAHARGIVHRDIKPANIMLGQFGEVHVLDWGIAKVKGAPELGPAGAPGEERIDLPAHDGTADGTLLGTPGYMAPEQVRGEIGEIDARSDVFALGAVLFEILVLAPLFPGRTAHERLAATLRQDTSRSPAAAAPEASIAPELDAAVLGATAPRRADRHATAGELAEEVDRYLDGDRDVAARAALAGEQVEKAKELLAEAAAGRADEAEARATAVRALARAVALDPHHPEASTFLGRLLMETPKKLPREVAGELLAAHRKAAKVASGAGVIRAGGAAFLLIVGLTMGVRAVWTGLVAIVGLVLAGALSAAWLRARNERAQEVLRIATLLSAVTGLTAFSYGLGPSILVPALAMINGFLLLGQADFRSSRLIIAMSAVPVLWRFSTAFLGLSSPPYEITPDRIVLPASLVSFPSTLTLTLLVISGTVQVVGPLVVVAALRQRLRAMEERLFLHSWHLRQLAGPRSPEPGNS